MGGDVTTNELRNALGHMNSNTSPGSNGLPTAFYITFFEVIGAFLLPAINTVLRRRIKPPSFGKGQTVIYLTEVRGRPE
ncbi:hypothetical protein HPB50_008252 [Hyalomma asiaticum]|uniref:Uncharacterized protein n=1 Tax=Hyalomma asiaticum TaxID=266040 RepID=A0ACB7T6N9_HYAAI|nr:hypothetical protein HPB50_008252 [Hyalomma asiaticum]